MLSREHAAAWDWLRRSGQERLMRILDVGGFTVNVDDDIEFDPTSYAPMSQTVTVRTFSCTVDEIFRAVMDAGFEIPQEMLSVYRYARGHRMTPQMERQFFDDYRGGLDRRWPDAPSMNVAFDPGTERIRDEVRAFDRVERAKKEQEERVLAEAKALDLVKRVVTPAEFAEYQEKKSIELTGKVWIYKIKKAGQTEIRALGCRHYKGSACVQLTVQAPAEDLVVTNYLTIKNDEKRWLETANITWADPEDSGKKVNAAIMEMLNENIRDHLLFQLSRPMFE